MNYTFRHFVVIEGKKMEVEPTKDKGIADKCKQVLMGMATGKEHVLKSREEVAQ